MIALKRLLLLAALLGAAYGGIPDIGQPLADTPAVSAVDTLADAYENRRSDIQIRGEGKVIKLLPDDRSGSRHQRILIRLANGQTLLIAHNIDLAPRIDDIRVGDQLVFFGEYEWNAKGGVIHWTHRDPRKRHIDGWLEHNGRRFQ